MAKTPKIDLAAMTDADFIIEYKARWVRLMTAVNLANEVELPDTLTAIRKEARKGHPEAREFLDAQKAFDNAHGEQVHRGLGLVLSWSKEKGFGSFFERKDP